MHREVIPDVPEETAAYPDQQRMRDPRHHAFSSNIAVGHEFSHLRSSRSGRFVNKILLPRMIAFVNSDWRFIGR
jgi:hypothetical protein